MENSSLKRRILKDIEQLISLSCASKTISGNFKEFHKDLVKMHYNAADASFDYHRKRVSLDIVMDDSQYDPKTVNMDLSVLKANLWFKNLKGFLKSCLGSDHKSLAFYAGLLRFYAKKDVPLVTV